MPPDPNEDEEKFLEFLTRQGVPQDFAAEVLGGIQKEEIATTANRHEFFNIIETLNEDQMRLMRDLMQYFTTLPNDTLRALIGWYQAWFQAELGRVHHECPACKENHERQLHGDDQS